MKLWTAERQHNNRG